MDCSWTAPCLPPSHASLALRGTAVLRILHHLVPVPRLALTLALVLVLVLALVLVLVVMVVVVVMEHQKHRCCCGTNTSTRANVGMTSWRVLLSAVGDDGVAVVRYPLLRHRYHALPMVCRLSWCLRFDPARRRVRWYVCFLLFYFFVLFVSTRCAVRWDVTCAAVGAAVVGGGAAAVVGGGGGGGDCYCCLLAANNLCLGLGTGAVEGATFQVCGKVSVHSAHG